MQVLAACRASDHYAASPVARVGTSFDPTPGSFLTGIEQIQSVDERTVFSLGCLPLTFRDQES
jgi:hypothetical protein